MKMKISLFCILHNKFIKIGGAYMFTVFMKGDSLIFQSGFESYREAEAYGWNVFGPGNFEIERE